MHTYVFTVAVTVPDESVFRLAEQADLRDDLTDLVTGAAEGSVGDPDRPLGRANEVHVTIAPVTVP